MVALGGATDIFARAVSQKLGEKLGTSIVVDNKPGAGGSIGSDIVAKARTLRVGAGLSTGVLTTTTGTSGPPLVLWFEHLGCSPHEQRDTLAASFLILGFLGVGALLIPGGANFSLDPVHVAVLLACTLIGQVVGREVFVRLDPRAFRMIGFALVLLMGVASIVAGVAG